MTKDKIEKDILYVQFTPWSNERVANFTIVHVNAALEEAAKEAETEPDCKSCNNNIVAAIAIRALKIPEES